MNTVQTVGHTQQRRGPSKGRSSLDILEVMGHLHLWSLCHSSQQVTQVTNDSLWLKVELDKSLSFISWFILFSFFFSFNVLFQGKNGFFFFVIFNLIHELKWSSYYKQSRSNQTVSNCSKSEIINWMQFM